MEHRSDSVGALSIQLSMACLLCMAVYWFSEGRQTGLVFPMALIPCAPALYGLNRLFLRRERSMRALVFFNLFVGGICFAILAAGIEGNQRGTWACAAVLCAWLTVQGAKLAVKPPALSRVILCLDASLVALILFVAYGAAVQIPAYQMIPACVGGAGSLLGLMICRTGGRLGARGGLFAAVVCLAILASVFLLAGSVAAPVGQGVVALWNALTAAVRRVAALLGRGVAWFFSLFPEESKGGLEWELDMDLMQSAQIEAEEGAEATPAAMAVMAVLLVTGVLLLAIGGLRLLGRIRMGGMQAVPTTRTCRRRIPLLEGLRRLMGSWVEHFRMRIWLIRNRNTPRGLFYLLIRRCRMGPWHKRRGETPREFLLRLRRSTGGDPELAAALDELIPAVDAALYAPSVQADRIAHARLIRRRIGASVRRQFIRDSLERLPWSGKRIKTHSPY